MKYDAGNVRPLPDPPCCRGTPLGDGNYMGCALGYGDVPPFTPPCDCPVCCGSGLENSVLATLLPHELFGRTDCCGCLNGSISGDVAGIVCNECGAVVRTLPADELQRTLDETELSLEVCSEMCPHCGKVNVFPGFAQMMPYTCCACGRAVEMPNER